MAASVGPRRLLLLVCCVLLVSFPSSAAIKTTTTSPTTNNHNAHAKKEKAPSLSHDDAAFATILYDHGADSAALLLAIRVLLRSIRDSQTKFRRLVIVPRDGLAPQTHQLLARDDPDLEIVRADIPNTFLRTRLTDPRAQLMHMRNKLVLWDDPTLAQLKRIVYLDPENLVLRNADEIFECAQFCAVDNGQSIVYANSLLVVSPGSVAARNLFSDAIDSFMISGRSYDYVGILQGFLPGLFEALEESPLFYVDDDEDDSSHPAQEESASVVRRLPFYYSINHMVFYERMNWDLYKCKDKNASSQDIPGPLLSYKYSGATLKPWFWLPYAYFQVFWEWHDVRLRLNEDHLGFFLGRFTAQTVLFGAVWALYVAVCLKLRSDPAGRMRRLSSWYLPTANPAPGFSLDILNTRVVRRACQLSCNLLFAVSSTPIMSSILLMLLIFWTSIYSIPPLMIPRYAAILWATRFDSLVMTVVVVYTVAHTFRTAEWKKGGVPSTLTLFLQSMFAAVKQIPGLLVMQFIFLQVVGHTNWFVNPVLRPTVLIALLGEVLYVGIRIMVRQMRRVGHK